jgi:ABC-type transport system involved in multi-copper enzyme maturation permease subunit
MTGALAYEWRRITTVRATYWFTGLAIAVSAVIAFFIAVSFTASDLTADGIGTFSQASTLVVTAGGSVFVVPVVSAAFCAVIGAMSFGHEYRYGTIKQSLIAIPNRLTMFTAKLVVLVGWLLAVMLVVVVIDLVVGALFLTDFTLRGEAVRPIVDLVLYSVGFGIAGFGLAAVFRNLAGGLVAVLVYPFIVESIAYNIVRLVQAGTVNRLANLFPAAAGRRTIFLPYRLFASPDSGSDVRLHVWGLATSTAVYWCGLLLLVGFALVLFLRRDA